MSENTKNLDLFKYDVETDAKSTFDINKALNQNFDKIDSASENFLNKQQITNCILEVPQRIKYTLENGTLTVKAGSVVIVPYGVEDLTAQYPVGSTFIHDNFKVVDTQFEDGKFFVWAEAINDISQSTASTMAQDRLHVIVLTTNSIASTANPTSGETDTTVSGASLHYNTSINKVGKSVNGSTTATYENICSLPILSGKSSTTFIFDTIDQIFNGMGYIGSTIWIDKGVKGLIPNGRNEDGTLRNIEFTTNKLLLNKNSISSNKNCDFVYQVYAEERGDENSLYFSNKRYQVELDGYVYSNTGLLRKLCVLGTYSSENTVITSFQPNQPFRAIDYSDKSEVSGWGMPSNKYIDLTLGASGTHYTAPANGWAVISKVATGAGQYFAFDTKDNRLGVQTRAHSNGDYLQQCFPLKKGDVFAVNYTVAGNLSYFRFIYAEGEI